MALTPEDIRLIERIQQMRPIFDAYLKAHRIDDLKILLSTHFPLVVTALVGFVCVVVLLAHLL